MVEAKDEEIKDLTSGKKSTERFIRKSRKKMKKLIESVKNEQG